MGSYIEGAKRKVVADLKAHGFSDVTTKIKKIEIFEPVGFYIYTKEISLVVSFTVDNCIITISSIDYRNKVNIIPEFMSIIGSIKNYRDNRKLLFGLKVIANEQHKKLLDGLEMLNLRCEGIDFMMHANERYYILKL